MATTRASKPRHKLRRGSNTSRKVLKQQVPPALFRPWETNLEKNLLF
jgi:hypothetical protein